MKRISSIVLPILTAMMLLAGCNSSNVGLFFSLENVVAIKEEGRGLDDASPIKSFAETSTSYLLTTSVLRVRTIGVNDEGGSGYEWKTVNLPSGYGLAFKVVFDGTDIVVHAGRDSDSGITTGLFSVAEAGISHAGAGSVSWTDITPALASDERISNLFILDGDIVAEISRSTGIATAYRLYNVTSTIDMTTESPLPFVDVAYDGLADYWFITSNGLYNSQDIAGTIDLSTVAVPDGAVDLTAAPFVDGSDPLWSVENSGDPKIFGFTSMAVDGNTVYLATEGGYVFYSNATTWTVFTSGGSPVRYSDGSEFTDFTGLAVSDISGSNQVFAGSRNEGYVILDATGGVGSETVTYYDPQDQTSTNLFSTDLYRGNISRLVDGSGEDVIFALTPNTGLWRGTIVDSKLIWVRE
jgi:hypothetical protein